MKKIKGLFAIVAIILLICCVAMPAFAENLLLNGGFEELDENGLPLYWETGAYRLENTDTLFLTEADAYEGDYCAMIVSSDMNDARFLQTVSVKASTLYRLSGFLRVNDLPDVGIGANLSVAEIYYEMDGFFDTDGEWAEFVAYGETGEEQTEVTIYARLGGYGGESSGSVAFDNLSLVEVDAVPGDFVAKRWDESETVYAEPLSLSPLKEAIIAQPFTLWLVLLGIAFIAVFLLLLPKTAYSLEAGTPSHTVLFAAGVILSMVLRGIIGYFVRGYEVDINCFLSWSNTMYAHQPAAFYQNTSFCDYVPGYLYVLWFNGWLMSIFSSQWHVLIIKMVPILCDALGAVILFGEAKKAIGSKAALVLGLLYAFNPAAILNSAAWGQIDSVLALLLLGVAIFAMKHEWQFGIPLFFVAVLVKPQALMFGPLGLVALVMDLKKNKDLWLKAFIGLGVGIMIAVITIIPFNGDRSGDWIFKKYEETLSSYANVTLNTANFFYLLGLNWVKIAEKVPMATVIAISGALLTFGLALLLKKSNRTVPTLVMGTLLAVAAVCIMAFGHNSYEALGTILIVLTVLVSLYQYFVSDDVANLPLAGGNMLLFLYVFGTKMHERYLFPALILYALAYVKNRDWRILAVLASISVTVFINCGIILDNSLRLGSLSGHLLGENVAVGSVLACINMAAALVSTLVCYDLLVARKEPMELKAKDRMYSSPPPVLMNTADEALLYPKDARLHMKKRDYLIMFCVTALYSVLVLCNLGSFKAPQTGYEAKAPADEMVFDLGESQTFRMLYFGGISYSNFNVYVSDDNENWSEPYTAEMSEGQSFRWKYLTESYSGDSTLKFTATRIEPMGRYVKISPINVLGERPLRLNEIIFRDLAGDRIAASAANPAAELLLDEQDTLEGEPSWYNSSYFDEIYHARTAYEHANGIWPVHEWTHPPLGKVIMSWFIMLFGMTPFVWRFAGALMGILMLPAMYLLGKQLFRETSYATVAMLLMTFDCMHLTQTRIATIDSFPVLFIMVAYLFMLRYMKMDIWGKGLFKSCVPLFFSGVFMGLAIASKWIGIYAGVGLALLFFYASFQHLRQHRAAQKYDIVEPNRRRAVARAKYYGLSQVAWTWLLCIVFFIAVPALIYYLSYIPHFAPSGSVTIKQIVDLSIGTDYGNGVRTGGMLGYHGTPGLGMDHPYYSPWYEWPLILKPMYYASDNYVPQGFAYSIFCMGNPAVWWMGIIGMAFVSLLWVKRHIYEGAGGFALHVRPRDRDIACGFILIAFLSQYLPWVLVPRGTYIYHYFASVPFIILATVALLKWLCDRFKKKGAVIMWLFVAVCAVCFIILYPYASGITVPEGWLDFGKNLMINRNIFY